MTKRPDFSKSRSVTAAAPESNQFSLPKTLTLVAYCRTTSAKITENGDIRAKYSAVGK